MNSYIQIVRWNGALGDFTVLANCGGTACAVRMGDVVKATIVGSTITAYVNGVQKAQAIDSTYSNGSPGMGFNGGGNVGGVNDINGDFGFMSLTASD